VLADPPDGRGTFRYSNLGYVLAGAAIDRITGSTYESALRTELLDPLGVTTAGFGPPPRLWGHRPRLQIASLCIGRGKPAGPDDLRSDNPPLLTPAGRLHLSLADWARVQRLFLDGTGLLGPASLGHILQTPSDGRGMAMGWAAPQGLPDVALGMQGSNTAWAATAMIDIDRSRMALVITNDGRTSMLRATALLAADVLRDRHS
jgi:CubicO group peptidase (beta-lactamase class C family)